MPSLPKKDTSVVTALGVSMMMPIAVLFPRRLSFASSSLRMSRSSFSEFATVLIADVEFRTAVSALVFAMRSASELMLVALVSASVQRHFASHLSDAAIAGAVDEPAMMAATVVLFDTMFSIVSSKTRGSQFSMARSV